MIYTDEFFEKMPLTPAALRFRSNKKSDRGVNDLPHLISFYDQDIKLHVYPPYAAWSNMLRRCFKGAYKDRRPTYAEVECAKDWLLCSNFTRWHKANYKPGYVLDKDILVAGNKLYSADTCVYIPAWLNAFVLTSGKSRGQYPIGVHYHKHTRKYMAQCNIEGKETYIGVYATPEQAHIAWREVKLRLAAEKKELIESYHTGLYSAVVRKIMEAK